MKLQSSAFEHGGVIPDKYTCKGNNINPPLMVTEISDKTKTLALVLDDPDAPMGIFVHWLVWNIKPVEGLKIAEATVPSGSVQGKTVQAQSSISARARPQEPTDISSSCMLLIKGSILRRELEKRIC